MATSTQRSGRAGTSPPSRPTRARCWRSTAAALAIRRATPDLTLAGFELLLPDDPDLVVYRRGEVVVALNMSDHERTLPADVVAGLRVLVSSVAEPASGRRGSNRNGNDQAGADVLGPDAAVWLGR